MIQIAISMPNLTRPTRMKMEMQLNQSQSKHFIAVHKRVVILANSQRPKMVSLFKF